MVEDLKKEDEEENEEAIEVEGMTFNDEQNNQEFKQEERKYNNSLV